MSYQVIKPVKKTTTKTTKAPIRLEVNSKGTGYYLYSRIPALNTGMVIQNRDIPTLVRLVSNPKAWEAEMELLRSQLADFIGGPDEVALLKAQWGIDAQGNELN